MRILHDLETIDYSVLIPIFDGKNRDNTSMNVGIHGHQWGLYQPSLWDISWILISQDIPSGNIVIENCLL